MKVGDRLRKEWNGENIGDFYIIRHKGIQYKVELIEIDRKFNEAIFKIIEVI
jgi:hypothetical protein